MLHNTKAYIKNHCFDRLFENEVKGSSLLLFFCAVLLWKLLIQCMQSMFAKTSTVSMATFIIQIYLRLAVHVSFIQIIEERTVTAHDYCQTTTICGAAASCCHSDWLSKDGGCCVAFGYHNGQNNSAKRFTFIGKKCYRYVKYFSKRKG